MSDQDASHLIFFGTNLAEPEPQRLVAGALEADLLDGALRGVRWHCREIVRAINCPIRDVDWGTYLPEDVSDRIELVEGRFLFERRFAVAGGALSGQLTFTGGAAGVLRAELTLVASADFRTNRAGFTVLHPLRNFAGKPIRVVHAKAPPEDVMIPTMIAPSQPVFDIAAMHYQVDGAQVSLCFEGEVFEMEDQRNWTDASFKTYCRPLERPWPYTISKGETVRQAIMLTLSGEPVVESAQAHMQRGFSARPSGTPALDIALAAESGWLPTEAELGTIALLPVDCVQLRLVRGDTQTLSDALPLIGALQADLDLELVVSDERDTAAVELSAVGHACAAVGVVPKHVTALPEAYLKSYQPTAVWPDGLSPGEAADAARAVFPYAQIGGGMLTNFTEMNRRRPDGTLCDYITHGTTAIVHAADDRSVLETLDALAHVFKAGEGLADGRGYRLGLVSIGMRSNPYGAAVADNPSRLRKPMAQIDPRQDGLFGAAWAVGVLAATEDLQVAALSLAAPSGPFGLRVPGGGLRPLFHVVRAAGAMSGAERLSFSGLPDNVVTFGVRRDGGMQAMFANLGPAPVAIDASGRVSILNCDAAGAASRDPRWLDKAPVASTGPIELQSFSIAFVGPP